MTLTTNVSLDKIDFSPCLVADSDAKKILQPTRSKTVVSSKFKTPVEGSKKERLVDKQFAEESQGEDISTRA